MENKLNQRKIGIVNYGAGNIFSLCTALERIGLEYGMIHTPSDLDGYKRVIIPGVGHAGKAMEKLKESGMIDALLGLEIPVLGICVGMQLLTRYSEEGNSDLLGVFPLNTVHFNQEMNLKIPHMGWNTVSVIQNHPLFLHVDQDSYFYFVHSYYVPFDDQYTIGTAEYGTKYAAAIAHKNFFGVQFHPEKSGKAGEQVLLNFASNIY
jgi:glutamine amidotransferase